MMTVEGAGPRAHRRFFVSLVDDLLFEAAQSDAPCGHDEDTCPCWEYSGKAARWPGCERR